MFYSAGDTGVKNRQPMHRGAFAAGAVLFIVLTVIALFHSTQAYALRVTMKRVVFEGSKRTELLTIVNNTAEEQVYRLGWRRMRMTEDRSLVYLEDGDPGADLRPVDNMVRFAPRRVVLAPGASQQIRLMLRRPKDLPDGEYRSHFWIEPEAEAVKFDPKPSPDSDKGPNIQIKMLTGMTLPVFVRAGAMTASAKITDIKVTPGGKGMKVSMMIHREGNRSLYGDMDFFCTGVSADKPQREIKGVAVYTEVAKRRVEFEIPAPESGSCGPMRVVYTATEEDALFKGAVMAEAMSQ